MNFIPREHKSTLIIVRALMIKKMYFLLNSASLLLTWDDRVGFHLSWVQCQNVEAFRALILTLLYFRITRKATPLTNYITDSGGRIKVWVFHKPFQAIPMSVKVENHILGISRQWPNNLLVLEKSLNFPRFFPPHLKSCYVWNRAKLLYSLIFFSF